MRNEADDMIPSLPFSLLCMHTDRQEQMWVPALYLSFCPQRKKESNDRISTWLLSRAYWPPLLLPLLHYHLGLYSHSHSFRYEKGRIVWALILLYAQSNLYFRGKKIQLIFYFFLMIRCFYKILFPGPISWCKIRKKDFKEDFDHPKEVKNQWKLNEASSFIYLFFFLM